MTPVDQEFMHDPENGIQGDCERAVIASLLDLPIQEVPHFLAEYNGDIDDYYTRVQTFLASKGFIWVTTRVTQLYAFGDCGDIYHQISGSSPRDKNKRHAVVGKNGQILHDPHPSRAGLVGDPALWSYSFLVKLNK